MIAGHLAVAAVVACAGARSLDDTRLAVLVAAAFAPDLLDGLFVVAGICNPYGLYSHTLPVVVILAAVVGGAVLLTSSVRTDAAIVAVAVLAHAPADFFTGRKLFWPGAELVGWQLYDRPWLDFAVEAPLVIVAWWLLRRKQWSPRWSVSILVLVAVLAGQATFDVLASRRKGTVKPNACTVAWQTADGVAPLWKWTSPTTRPIRHELPLSSRSG